MNDSDPSAPAQSAADLERYAAERKAGLENPLNRSVQTEFIWFPDRQARSRYIIRRFEPYLKGKVLDVGCDEAVIKEVAPNLDYYGIDVGGKPDQVVDLERAERLPFDDNQFDCVLCTDVLEHLDSLHRIFLELFRVGSKTVIISLPNNWEAARRHIHRGYGFMNKYGLPVDRPVDRHKWFFSMTDAVDFIDGHAKAGRYRILELIANERKKPWPSRAIRRMIYSQPGRYLNRYTHTLWAVLEPSV